MFENIVLSFQSVWAHKIRSFLTMLGIIIGIASIITIVSTIKGTNEQIKKNLIGSGTNAVEIRLYREDQPFEPQYEEDPEGAGEIDGATLAKLEALEHVERASAYHKRSYADNVYFGAEAYSGELYGIDEAYLPLYGYTVERGRGFTAQDHLDRRKVALVDDLTARSLFSGADPIGQTLEIGGDAFVVVGTLAQRAAYTPVIRSMDDYYTYVKQSGGKIFLPDSVWPIVARFDEPRAVSVRTDGPDSMTDVGKAAAQLLTATLSGGGDLSYRSEDLLEQAKQLQELSGSTNRQLIWIAGISLIVGGIGVMNIMLVTVTERTREIGLKKAIGARKNRILKQFLTEAAVLTSLGGIIGVAAGIALAKVLSYLMQTPSAISVPAILIAVGFSMLIGVLFGLIPAVKAANLNPIDALRRE